VGPGGKVQVLLPRSSGQKSNASGRVRVQNGRHWLTCGQKMARSSASLVSLHQTVRCHVSVLTRETIIKFSCGFSTFRPCPMFWLHFPYCVDVFLSVILSLCFTGSLSCLVQHYIPFILK
jgi:hypothetical protein